MVVNDGGKIRELRCMCAQAHNDIGIRCNEQETAWSTGIADGLRLNKSITESDMSDNNLSSTDMVQIANSLSENETLETLDLNSNTHCEQRTKSVVVPKFKSVLQINDKLRVLKHWCDSHNGVLGLGSKHTSARCVLRSCFQHNTFIFRCLGASSREDLEQEKPFVEVVSFKTGHLLLAA